MLPVIVVHGGAGSVPKDTADISCVGVRDTVRAGYAILQAGGSAMDAVVETVTLLENNPVYNAGTVLIFNLIIKYYNPLHATCHFVYTT